MMPIHIYVAFDHADASTAADLCRQLSLVFQPREVVFWQDQKVATEDYRHAAGLFLEKTDLFVALLSMNFEDDPNTRWAVEQARQGQRRRPSLQIISVQGRSAPIPSNLLAFPMALPPEETLEKHPIARDRQLQRAAQRAKAILEAAPKAGEHLREEVYLPLIVQDVQERLLAQTDRYNPMALLGLLNQMVADVRVKRDVLDLEDALKSLQERARLSKITMAELEIAMEPLRYDLQQLILNLRENELSGDWKTTFIRDYFRFVKAPTEAASAPPYFVPCDEIAIPETLNLTVGPREHEALEQIGLLSYEQKLDFRRSLLLCRDALAVQQYDKAYAHCEHARHEIDPQSAQLYEYLLLTYLQKEGAERIMHDAIYQTGKLLNFVALYAGRMQDYQREGKCPTTTGPYNLEMASEALSDAALRVYHGFQNDYIRHTGHHASDVPDQRATIQNILVQTFTVNRAVHPYEEFLETAIIEYCGGGKCHWIGKVEVAGDYFRFLPLDNFDLEGEVAELLQLLLQMESEGKGKVVKQRATLREDVYYSLMAKRQHLRRQLEEDRRVQRPFTDLRESIIRFVYSCLFAAHVFGDEDEDARGQSFLRMALEYLLPGLVLETDAALALGMRWFILDETGEVQTHSDCARYGFDARGITEKILEDHSGRAGWLQVQPSLKQEVYLQFAADTLAVFEQVYQGLQWSDFRRMDSLDARRLLIDCIRRFVVCYRAYPQHPSAQDYLDRCIVELCGEGLLLWMYHDPETLANEPESVALGYDARTDLRKISALGTRFSENDLRRMIADNLFQKRLLPAYTSLKTHVESLRPALVQLLKETLSNYKLFPDPRYLELVFRELVEETKLPWIDIDEKGRWTPISSMGHFNPIAVLPEISTQLVAHGGDREQYDQLSIRKAIAQRRHADQVSRYFHEISEFKSENRRPEREIAIAIIRKIKAIYHFYPEASFLELPYKELSDKGRIRWHALFLGTLPTRENHFENQFYKFNYRFELFEIKRLLEQQYQEMERVLREM